MRGFRARGSTIYRRGVKVRNEEELYYLEDGKAPEDAGGQSQTLLAMKGGSTSRPTTIPKSEKKTNSYLQQTVGRKARAQKYKKFL